MKTAPSDDMMVEDTIAKPTVYEDVLEELLLVLRANIVNRIDSGGMPAGSQMVTAVKARLAWMAATEKDLDATRQLALFGSGDDVEVRKMLWLRVRDSLVDMAAWLVDARLREEWPLARTRAEIAEDAERERQAKERKGKG